MTLSICNICNNAGTHKLPLMVIGKSAKPRAFKSVSVKSLPVLYRSVKTTWMTQQIFKKWFHSKFAPAVTKHLGAKTLPVKALLLLDNAPSHPSADELKVGDIEVFYFPANVTSAVQPMDQGMIESFKRRYRRKLLTALIEDGNSDLSVIVSLKSINLKDVIYMIAES